MQSFTIYGPKKATAFNAYIMLETVSDVEAIKANPTLAAGDAQVSIDGAAFANLTTLPAVTPAGGRGVKVALSAAEMNGDVIQVFLEDQTASADWQPACLIIYTRAVTADDLVRSTTPANTLDVDAAGEVTPADGSITAAKLASDAITAAKIASDAITAAKIATGAITAAKFAAGAIDAAAIADNAIGAGALATGAITAAKFAADAITSTVVADNTITAAKIASSAIADTKLATGAITAAKFAAGAIDAAAIATGAIDADAIADNAIDAGAIASNAITAAKIATDAITAAKVATDVGTELGGAIADAVWDEATAGHTTADTFGAQAATKVDAILEDTATDGVKLNFAQAMSEGQTARTLGGALEIVEAAERNKVVDTGEGGVRTVYRSDGTTPLAARTRTSTSFTP